MTPWTDRSGKFSPLKATVLAGACLPALLLAWAGARGTLAPAAFARPARRAPDHRGDPPDRRLGDPLPVAIARGHAAQAHRQLAKTHHGAAHARRDGAVLRAGASDALHG